MGKNDRYTKEVVSALRLIALAYAFCSVIVAFAIPVSAVFFAFTSLVSLESGIALSGLHQKVKARAVVVLGWFAMWLFFWALYITATGFEVLGPDSWPVFGALGMISLIVAVFAHRHLCGRLSVSWNGLGCGLLSWVVASSIAYAVNARQYTMSYFAVQLATATACLFIPFVIPAFLAMLKSRPRSYVWASIGMLLGFVSFAFQSSIYGGGSWDLFAHPVVAYSFWMPATIFMIMIWLARSIWPKRSDA